MLPPISFFSVICGGPPSGCDAVVVGHTVVPLP
jgi:hypothetical protein